MANGNGNSISAWQQRLGLILAIAGVLAILATAIYAWSDVLHCNAQQDDEIEHLQTTYESMDTRLDEMDRKLTRAVVILERLED